MNEPAPAAIEVYADVWCTFAHVGLRMAAAQRRLAGRDDVPIIVRGWPLELVNGAPMDPAKVMEHVGELQAHVAPDLFSHVDPDHFPMSTLGALALTERAYRHGAATGERAAFLVRDALFEQGRNIADARVLASLADELGIEPPTPQDHAAVMARYNEGRRRGVVGSPHFFHGDQSVFCPSLDIRRGEDGLVVHADTAALQSFLHDVFG